MRLTQEVIKKSQLAMVHTKKDGTVNWSDGDEIAVCLAGTFAGDKFISSITVPLRAPTASTITFAMSSGSIAFSGELPGSKFRLSKKV